jgi:tetratricopeptide (TPR) repeat protein
MRKHPAWGYADLAELHMRVARVDEAVQQWTRAGEMAPDVTSVQTSLAQARLAQQRWKAVEKDLPAKRHLQKLVPFPMRGRNLWVALTCKYCPTDEFYREDARLALYEEHQGQFISLWRSDVIPSIEERGFHPNVWAFPMTGSKRPELVFLGVCSGGSANPTLMQIFRWTGEGFRRELEAQSGEQPLWIEDLRHNGRYQVRCVDYIGSRDGHSDENHVRWPNIYAWNGDQYVLSNAKYPAAFRESRQKLLVCLHDNPEDPELLEYLGKTYLYEHRIREARACFSKMEPACRKSIQAGRSNPDDQIRDWQHLGEVLGVQGRRTEATRCFRQAVSVCRNRAREDPSDQAYYRNMEAHAAEQIRSLLSRR